MPGHARPKNLLRVTVTLAMAPSAARMGQQPLSQNACAKALMTGKRRAGLA